MVVARFQAPLSDVLAYLDDLGITEPLPPSTRSALPWSDASQSAAGVLAILIGAAGLGATIYTATRPIVLLRRDGITDCRRRLEIPYADIRAVRSTRRMSGQKANAILLDMVDPARYADLEKWSKRSGLSDADLTLDLSLAKEADFEKALAYFQRHVR